MRHIPTIALVGDRDDRVTAHVAIPRALEAARMATGAEVGWHWLETGAVADTSLHAFAGFWLVPASPYRSLDGALEVVQFAREQGVPFLGTCGGFSMRCWNLPAMWPAWPGRTMPRPIPRPACLSSRR